MRLSELLQKIEYTGSFSEREIENVVCDSRKANGSSLLVCVRGFAADGHTFAKSAYERGCRAFVCEYRPCDLPDDASVMIVESSRKALALLSCALHSDPSHELVVIGITGTKGKTTTALIIKQALDASGIPCGYIGSNGIEWGDNFHSTVNTTPESDILQKYMRRMADDGMRALVLEVSSQALSLHRICGTKFDIGIFTNFSPDHIGAGEHASVEEYFNAKKSFFDTLDGSAVIANADDAATVDMLSGCKVRRVLCSTVRKDAELFADGIEPYAESSGLGVRFDCTCGGEICEIRLGMPGEFNVHNALSALATLHEFGVSTKKAAEAMQKISVRGRFETVPSPTGACFVIDYAHNGVSLTSALTALRPYAKGRLICLFGSVGGRTQIRRAQMGQAASALADLSILTSDNPDFEDPERIIDDIAFWYEDPKSYVRIADRQQAIRYAFSIARSGDVVLLAGKGHERYQTICGVNEYFSERETLLDCINEYNLTAQYPKIYK